ncbi:MAG: sulfatase [Planctomycetota bacterium]
MLRFNRLSVVAFSMALLAVVSNSHAESAGLNVLLITADDLGLQLNCYGDDTVPTPNLNTLAAQSVQFQTAYVAQASCSSSRSAMLTGTYPHTNGQYGLANAGVGFRATSASIRQSIPNVLKQNGYRTAVIGKLHVNPDREFDLDLHQRDGFGSRQVSKQFRYAREFWRESGGQPWFVMFNVFDPHVNGKRAMAATAFPDVVDAIPQSPIGPSDVQPWPWQQIDTPAMRKRIAGYYNCVQRVDAAVGLLLGALDELGQRDRTLVIFLGDHGPPFSRGKTTCYEAGLRVPFLMDWPSVSQPHRSERLVSAVDIAPTVFDAANVTIPAQVQGQSLRSVAASESVSNWRATLVGEFQFHGASSFQPTRAITDGRYKLIHRLRGGNRKPAISIDGDPAYRELAGLSAQHPARPVFQRLVDLPDWELYDLQRDPGEFNDLSKVASMAGVKTRLQDSLQQWQQQTNDPFRDPEFCARVLATHSRHQKGKR